MWHLPRRRTCSPKSCVRTCFEPRNRGSPPARMGLAVRAFLPSRNDRLLSSSSPITASNHAATHPGTSGARCQPWYRILFPKNSFTRLMIDSSFLVSHSQMTKTLHPNLRRSANAWRSRATFLSNFSCQYRIRDLGVDALLHPGCRCQKQP